MVALGQSRGWLTAVADQRGNPLSALDIAERLLSLAEEWATGSRIGMGTTYHVSRTGAASWWGIADAILAELRKLGIRVARVDPIATADGPTKALILVDSRNIYPREEIEAAGFSFTGVGR